MDTLLRTLSDIADAVTVARATANQIAILISSRQYSTTEVRVQLLITDVLETFERANRFLGLARINSQHARDVASRLMVVSEVIEKARSLVVGVAVDALEEALAVEQAVAVSSPQLATLCGTTPTWDHTLHIPAPPSPLCAGSIEGGLRSAADWRGCLGGRSGCCGNWKEVAIGCKEPVPSETGRLS